MAARDRTNVDSVPSLILLSKRVKEKKSKSHSNTREEPRAAKQFIPMSSEPAIKYLDLLNCNGEIELRQSKTALQYRPRSTTDVEYQSMHSNSTLYPHDYNEKPIKAARNLTETILATRTSAQDQATFAALGALVQDVTQAGGDYSHIHPPVPPIALITHLNILRLIPLAPTANLPAPTDDFCLQDGRG